MNSSDDFGCIFEERTGDIAFANADYIVNAANATGYMGGFQSRLMLCKGVAESINYHTKGKAEKEAKKAAKEYRKNKTDTSLYFTSPCGLNCKQIIHAVTMKKAGQKSSYEQISKVLYELFEYLFCVAEQQEITVAISYLGCGTGGLDKAIVKELMLDAVHAASTDYSRLKVLIYDKK